MYYQSQQFHRRRICHLCRSAEIIRLNRSDKREVTRKTSVLFTAFFVIDVQINFFSRIPFSSSSSCGEGLFDTHGIRLGGASFTYLFGIRLSRPKYATFPRLLESCRNTSLYLPSRVSSSIPRQTSKVRRSHSSSKPKLDRLKCSYSMHSTTPRPPSIVSPLSASTLDSTRSRRPTFIERIPFRYPTVTCPSKSNPPSSNGTCGPAAPSTNTVIALPSYVPHTKCHLFKNNTFRR